MADQLHRTSPGARFLSAFGLARRTRVPCALIALGALTLLGVGCNRARQQPPQEGPNTPKVATTPGASGQARPLPTETFVPVTSWASPFAPDKKVAAPSASAETWRAYVHQFSPMQKKTPQWQPLSASKNVHLAMPPDSDFACFVTPLSIRAEAEMDLEAWVLSRELRCSADGYRTWTAYPHYVRVDPDGKRTRTRSVTRAALRERTASGKGLRQIVIQLRDDAQPTRATTGPPKIVEHKNHP